jgi:hypothetical protein
VVKQQIVTPVYVRFAQSGFSQVNVPCQATFTRPGKSFPIGLYKAAAISITRTPRMYSSSTSILRRVPANHSNSKSHRHTIHQPFPISFLPCRGCLYINDSYHLF